MRIALIVLFVWLALPCVAQNAGNLQQRPGSRHETRFAKMSPEKVKRYEDRLLRQVADLALIPPAINTSPLPDYDYDTQTYGIPEKYIRSTRPPYSDISSLWENISIIKNFKEELIKRGKIK